MSTIHITIPMPVLVAGQYFEVRYRSDPAHAWTIHGNEINDPFTITGLSPGTYQLSANLVRSGIPFERCEEVVQYFEVVEENPCGDFSFSIVANDIATLYTLQIVPGSILVTPPCGGYEVVYGIAGGVMNTVNYGNITGTITLPATNNTYQVTIRAVDCNGNYATCANAEVDPPEGGCTHATVTNAEIFGDVLGWHVRLTITQSLPPTNPFTVAYSQNNLFTQNPAINDPGGMISLAATPTTTQLVFNINPVFGFDPTFINGQMVPVLYYNGTLADRCRYSTKWSASLPIT